MHIKAPKDFWAGLMFMAFGVAFAVAARDYPMGTLARMDAGYFPFALALLLASLGLILLVRSFSVGGESVTRFHLRAGALLVGSIVLFGVLLRPFGLVAATLSLVVVAAVAGEELKPKWTLLLAVGLATFSVLVFHVGLGLSFKIFPWD